MPWLKPLPRQGPRTLDPSLWSRGWWMGCTNVGLGIVRFHGRRRRDFGSALFGAVATVAVGGVIDGGVQRVGEPRVCDHTARWWAATGGRGLLACRSALPADQKRRDPTTTTPAATAATTGMRLLLEPPLLSSRQRRSVGYSRRLTVVAQTVRRWAQPMRLRASQMGAPRWWDLRWSVLGSVTRLSVPR